MAENLDPKDIVSLEKVHGTEPLVVNRPVMNPAWFTGGSDKLHFATLIFSE